MKIKVVTIAIFELAANVDCAKLKKPHARITVVDIIAVPILFKEYLIASKGLECSFLIE